MNLWGEIGSIIIIAFYYIDKCKNIQRFTKQFNEYFHTDISEQTLHFEIARLNNVNPANNVNVEKIDLDYSELWNYYITQERVDKLKEIYTDFKNKRYAKKIEVIDEFEEILDKDIAKSKKVFFEDKPIICQDYSNSFEIELNKRRKEVVVNALCNADYSCEANCGVDLFLRKDGVHSYTEGHHLIPLCYQQYFNYSLDVEANVISLCPRCHRMIHYGADNLVLLKRLYNQRYERLIKCGLNISFEQLVLMYR